MRYANIRALKNFHHTSTEQKINGSSTLASKSKLTKSRRRLFVDLDFDASVEGTQRENENENR